jgi:uncharacterized protein (TIGR02284 family)
MTQDTTNKEAVSVLNDLIATCTDGIEGFRTSADAVQSPAAKALFSSRVRSIDTARRELQDAVKSMDGSPAESGHAAASLHRGWVNLKSAVTGKNDEAIIAETVRGEESAVKHYDEALKKPLPAEIKSIVAKQAEGARHNLAAMRALAAVPPGTSRTHEPVVKAKV